jgi:hypothetical protein
MRRTIPISMDREIVSEPHRFIIRSTATGKSTTGEVAFSLHDRDRLIAAIHTACNCYLPDPAPSDVGKDATAQEDAPNSDKRIDALERQYDTLLERVKALEYRADHNKVQLNHDYHETQRRLLDIEAFINGIRNLA